MGDSAMPSAVVETATAQHPKSTLSKNQRERLEKRIAAIESEISVLEDEVARLTAEMALPEVAADYERFQELSRSVAGKHEKVQRLYEEWDLKSSELG